MTNTNETTAQPMFTQEPDKRIEAMKQMLLQWKGDDSIDLYPFFALLLEMFSMQQTQIDKIARDIETYEDRFQRILNGGASVSRAPTPGQGNGFTIG